MKPIAYIHTDLPQKFGIPRNSFLAPHLQGRIVFEPEFALNSAVEGLDGFSHLWLLWQFQNGLPGGTANDIASEGGSINRENDPSGNGSSKKRAIQSSIANEGSLKAACGCDCSDAHAQQRETNAKRVEDPAAPLSLKSSWSPTVRPPRLGGAQRVGVFATRSPFRPNPIGLTCVKLDRVELTDEGPIVHVLGADLRDGTPIFDIKPYIPFADCHPDAVGGFIDEVPWNVLEVDFPESLKEQVPEGKLEGLIEVLRQDPRRAGSKHEPTRVYHLAYAQLDVAFTVDGDTLHVVCVS